MAKLEINNFANTNAHDCNRRCFSVSNNEFFGTERGRSSVIEKYLYKESTFTKIIFSKILLT